MSQGLFWSFMKRGRQFLRTPSCPLLLLAVTFTPFLRLWVTQAEKSSSFPSVSHCPSNYSAELHMCERICEYVSGYPQRPNGCLYLYLFLRIYLISLLRSRCTGGHTAFGASNQQPFWSKMQYQLLMNGPLGFN